VLGSRSSTLPWASVQECHPNQRLELLRRLLVLARRRRP
jgi:hypothetical protein